MEDDLGMMYWGGGGAHGLIGGVGTVTPPPPGDARTLPVTPKPFISDPPQCAGAVPFPGPPPRRIPGSEFLLGLDHLGGPWRPKSGGP